MGAHIPRQEGLIDKNTYILLGAHVAGISEQEAEGTILRSIIGGHCEQNAFVISHSFPGHVVRCLQHIIADGVVVKIIKRNESIQYIILRNVEVTQS